MRDMNTKPYLSKTNQASWNIDHFHFDAKKKGNDKTDIKEPKVF